MRLKRVLERTSCDFCYKRRVKCDRSTRIETDKCSQCSLRQISCSIDDSDDVRLQRGRRRERSSGPSTMRSEQDGYPVEVNASGHDQDEMHVGHDHHEQAGTSISMETMPTGSSSRLSELATVGMQGDLSVSNEFLSGLNVDSATFLDHVFLGYEQPYIWTEELLKTQGMASGAISTRDSVEQKKSTTWTSSNILANGGYDNYYAIDGIDTSDLHTALRAYFNLANLALPILHEDAFWVDYNAARCSRALIYAVACRGIPLTSVERKWDKQQTLACKFGEAFFEAQQPSIEHVRLDDLEKLALMVNFEYDKNRAPAAESRLSDLFFTHDSLVLTTLQAGAQSASELASTPLQRAHQRRSLLFWQVYGLDAFRSLDRSYTSRIRDTDVDINDASMSLGVAGYLDTILTLAVLARQLAYALGCPRARRDIFRLETVEAIYEKLHPWRKSICPPDLQWQSRALESDDRGEPSLSERLDQYNRLHGAIIALLELNCYMQIESYVSHSSPRNSDTLTNEILTHLTHYETLKTINGTICVFDTLSQTEFQGQYGIWHSLTDLSPSSSRDISAGVCTWLCLRGKDTRGGSQATVYLNLADKLRDAVAGAQPHEDTNLLVSNLDERLEGLSSRAGSAQGIAV